MFPHASAIAAAVDVPVPGTGLVDESACAARGVPAFTDGLVSHFASAEPPVHVAAHEAAHQLQHAALTNDQRLGPEGHAQGVADAVTRGRSARALIGPLGAWVGTGVRDYTDVSEADQTSTGQWQAGGKARVSDDGRTVTTSADKHACYADRELIEQSNAILRAKKSGVNITPGGAGPSGQAPDGSGVKSTVKVDYHILSDEDNEDFYADCGVSSREVQGPTGTDTRPRGVYTDSAGSRTATTRSYDPGDFRDEIYMKAGLGSDPASAHSAYEALSATDKDAFDKTHKINRYAAPGVGEAYTRRRDDRLGGTGFNWHWGGVIMAPGDDRVTFENYTKGHGYEARDEDWYFATYGPPSKPGQTWHDRWSSVGGLGKGTTLAAETSADPSPFTRSAAALTTADAIRARASSSNEGERMALESEIRSRWLKVTVDVVSAQEGTDEVYAVAKHGWRRYQTGEIDLSSGGRNTFWIPLDKLFPLSGEMGEITVEVYDSDTFSDDMISIIEFDDPYTRRHDNRPWDDAEYHTTIEFDR